MAKHDSLRKADRDKLIRKYHKKNPRISQEVIGEMFGGLCRARICQILKGK